jgi:preprotein translocase subunit SecF
MAVFIRNQGLTLIVLGIFAILVYVLFKFLWLIGIALIILGLLMFILGLVKK